MSCTAVAFNDRRECEAVRRRLLRDSKIFVQTHYCERCDTYHLRPGHANAVKVAARDLEIVRLSSLGMTRWEVARNTGVNEYTVDVALERMRIRFCAASTTNLVAILIALGFIDPNQFVPGITERKHA